MNGTTVKENARQALEELLGRIGLAEEAPQEAPAPEKTQEREEPAALPERAPTVIAAGTRITGNVDCEGPLEILGEVNGDVSSQESVCVRGTVIGAVRGKSVLLSGGRVRGDVAAEGAASLDAQAIAVGNVTAGSVQIDGRLKGNVTACGAARLLDRARIAGDVTASHFAMGERSILCGTVRIAPRQGEECDLEGAFEF